MSTDTAQFESRHAIGDTIVIPCRIKGVHFSDSKVKYIVEIGGYLLGIDSCDALVPEGEQVGVAPISIVQVIA